MDNAELLAIVSAIQAAWTAAFAARDAAALSRLYAAEVQFWGSTARLYRSRAGVAEYFTTLPPGFRRAVYDVPDVLALGPDTVSAFGRVTFVRAEAAGETGLPYRMTQVFTRQDGEWRISLHHASPVP